MTRAFAVRVAIGTPISLRGLLHLDGLLGSLVASRGLPYDDLPLERRDGIWLASAAILETGPFGAIDTTQVRIKHVVTNAVPAGILDHLKPGHRKIDTMSPMRNALTPYPTIEGVRAAWFTGRGNVDAVVELLADARNLGAMGRTGYGKVSSLEGFEAANDALTGLASDSGSPMRTVALAAWDALGLGRHTDAVVALQRPSPPYWTGPSVPCISPTQVTMTGTRTEIRAFLRCL